MRVARRANEMRHRHRHLDRRRDVVALVSVVAAIGLTAIAIPILAVRSAEDEGAGVVPPLPILLGLATLAVSIALLAVYRLALERARRRTGSGPAEDFANAASDDEVEPTPLATPTSRSPAAAPSGAASNDRSDGESAGPSGADELSRVVRTQVTRAVASARPPDAGIRGSSESPPERAQRPRRAEPRRTTIAAKASERRGGTAVQAGVDSPTPVEVAIDDPVDDEAAVETCEIVWWHGARKGGFEARIDADARRPRVAGRSRTIAWSERTPPPPEGTAADALRLLVERLEGEGWRAAGSVGSWYGARFVRPMPVELPRSELP